MYCVTAFGILKKDDKSLPSAPDIQSLFEGALNRKALGEALRVVMDREGFSQRKAAASINAHKSDIGRVAVGSASMEMAVKVLDELGYETEFTIKPKP